MYQVLRALLVCVTVPALSACDTSAAEPQPREKMAASAPAVESTRQSGTLVQSGTLGPLTYSFDHRQLTLTDVAIPIPPTYENSVFASKLIPAERAEMLGEEACTYGESGTVTACSAEREEGLSMALLERPLEEYREAFALQDIGAEELPMTELAGSTGFAFTAEAEGAGVEYRFIPVDDRTLLLARHFTTGSEGEDAAIEAVIETISRSTLPQHL